jgi:hypothetical protein
MGYSYYNIGDTDPVNSLCNGIRTSDEGYQALAVAIAVQAAKDLHSGSSYNRAGAREFFTAEDSIIHDILPNLDPMVLLDQIENNYNDHKNWKAEIPEEMKKRKKKDKEAK